MHTALRLTLVLALSACGAKDADDTETTGGAPVPQGGSPSTGGADSAVDSAGGGGGGGSGGGPVEPTGGAVDAGSGDGGAAPAEDAALPDPPLRCREDDLPATPWQAGPYGVLRHEIAEDFEVPVIDGRTFRLSEVWNGCESFVFLPDTLQTSPLEARSMWEDGLDDLVARSPYNVHYVFISRAIDPDDARAAADAMQTRVESTLASLGRRDREHWVTHLHVVPEPALDLGNWLEAPLRGHGVEGFAIDRFQRVRGVGSLADVGRPDAALQAQGGWPWASSLWYAAHEARRFNWEAGFEHRLASQDAVVVPIHTGEILEGFAETEIELPDAATLATFDRLEIEVDQRCPVANRPEVGNCGAWDYLAHLFVYDADMQRQELARFITTYHREARFTADATPMLVHLKNGGRRLFRWEYAPEWNKQPTATRLNLRFIRAATGVVPTELHPLWTGGGFNSMYNAERTPKQVAIPADAKRVELFAIITGHGAEQSQCAEFCDHRHEFTIGGRSFVKAHPEAGTESKCVEQIENGMTPNQAGTWWFGRGGWCPGQQVDPFIVDVTEQAVPGTTVEVSYRGLFAGGDPPDGSGNIVMTSHLVIYR
jgi:hypothetical protein